MLTRKNGGFLRNFILKFYLYNNKHLKFTKW